MEPSIKYIDHKSILVVNPAGQLRKVFVPFRVYVRGTELTQKQVYMVEEILTTERDEIVYVINSKPYYHHHFKLDILF
ncbi:MAG: hypothetical protein K9I70_09320 [Chitinophagaceae bacterium]|nr:hypothetical protein [Chitinophagaceae bacterium]